MIPNKNIKRILVDGFKQKEERIDKIKLLIEKINLITNKFGGLEFHLINLKQS